MKNVFKIVMVCATTMLCVQQSQAAAFTLTYGGRNAVKVMVDGLQYSVRREDSVSVNTGLSPVATISWTESVIMGKDGIKDGNNFNADTDSVVEKDYTLLLPKPVNALNVGGFFNIMADGKYTYYFGIDSDWNTVEGTVQQVGPARKVW